MLGGCRWLEPFGCLAIFGLGFGYGDPGPIHIPDQRLVVIIGITHFKDKTACCTFFLSNSLFV